MIAPASRSPYARRLPGRVRVVLLLIALTGGLLFLSVEPSAAEDTKGGAPKATAPQALDEYFAGRVIGLEAGTVTLRYDFKDAAQLKDFTEGHPFRIKTRDGQKIGWFDGRLEIVGNAGARHKAPWTGDLRVSATYTLDAEKDVGAFLTPVEGGVDYAIFTLGETHFHRFDNDSGGKHSIIKFGEQWRESGSTDDFIGFRYVARRPPKEPLAPGNVIPMTFRHEQDRLFMTVPDFELKGKDLGKPLGTVHIGFYAFQGRVLLDDLEIQGQLDPEWLRQEQIELRTVSAIGGAPTGDVDAATRALMDDHLAGKAKATRALLDLVKDTTRPAQLRDALVETLCRGRKATVRFVIDLLYNKDEGVREYGIQIIESHLGSDYGYKAGSSEERRSRAVRKLNEDLRDDPDLLKD